MAAQRDPARRTIVEATLGNGAGKGNAGPKPANPGQQCRHSRVFEAVVVLHKTEKKVNNPQAKAAGCCERLMELATHAHTHTHTRGDAARTSC